MNNENSATKKVQRIRYINIAKGISVILVIIEYTASFGILEQNMIFYFHMVIIFYFVYLSS